MCERLKKKLIQEGKNPYVIPVGGSNALGSFGYLEMVGELESQLKEGTEYMIPKSFDDILVATGR